MTSKNSKGKSRSFAALGMTDRKARAKTKENPDSLRGDQQEQQRQRQVLRFAQDDRQKSKSKDKGKRGFPAGMTNKKSKGRGIKHMATAIAGDVKRKALGRGLESLLPSRPKPTVEIAASAAAPVAEGKPLEIPVEQIDRNPFQTRKGFDEEKLDELAASIEASGVVQPIIVRLGDNGRYTLITGERRWLASQRVGKATIPAIVREVSDVQAMEMTIVENLQRADLNPMEQAHAFERLSREFKMTQEEMSLRTGKDRPSIGNFLRLLKLPEDVQMHLESGELSFGHAKALLALPPEKISTAAWKVLHMHLSVRSTEKYVQGIINPEMVAKPVKLAEQHLVDPNVREAEDRLRRSLGLKVTIEDKKGRGKVIIEYAGVDDFDAILGALGSSE
jgi:ParB family chromosome partitioning protein